MSEGGCPTQRCLGAMLEIVKGLTALHARGIVHRGAGAMTVTAAA